MARESCPNGSLNNLAKELVKSFIKKIGFLRLILWLIGSSGIKRLKIAARRYKELTKRMAISNPLSTPILFKSRSSPPTIAPKIIAATVKPSTQPFAATK